MLKGRTLVLACLLACSSAPPPPPQPHLVTPAKRPRGAGKGPDWVLRTPRMNGSVCAVGAVDRTFHRQDGLTNAAEAARSELARTVESKVNSMLLDVADGDGGWVKQVIDTTTDVVVHGAEILEYWYDEDGSVQAPGMTWALACMKTDSSVAELAAKLKEATSADDPSREEKIAKVRERAAAAFDELEAMEAKQ